MARPPVSRFAPALDMPMTASHRSRTRHPRAERATTQ
jgi:hypothetical protein